ncbi:MAG: mutM [Verrucomicrobiales bacterium]|nr:mutM [Verrucomicrobiales bacterium]
MPELAEVEYYRNLWKKATGAVVKRVELNAEKRVFRKTSPGDLAKKLPGSRLIQSYTHGKQMLFGFSNHCWLGVHLGMSGSLKVEPKEYKPQKHDHLVLITSKGALVFNDPRMFGLILFEQSQELPLWWSRLPPDLMSDDFNLERLEKALKGKTAPLKALLLTQKSFPGLGNWMVDEILWQAHLKPARQCNSLKSKEKQILLERIKTICRVSVERIGQTYGDVPEGWLFHQRWSPKGKCPLHKTPLKRTVVAGRTTAWCSECQR